MPDLLTPIPLLALAPFGLMLGAVALLPLLAGRFWERRGNKLIVAVAMAGPAAWFLLTTDRGVHLWHTLLFDYVPFVILLGALFVITGGIAVTGDIEARPRINAAFLGAGAVLASFMGTTGASMLLIRPLLQTNRERQFKGHTVLFFIAIVANCGGLLTPLGDPPLFLLYLRGVPFGWFLGLWPAWLFVNALLLAAYVALDTFHYHRETAEAVALDRRTIVPLRIAGAGNVIWLLGVVLSVAFLNGQYVAPIAAHRSLGLVREGLILLLAVASLVTTPRRVRAAAGFTWGPIAEVAIVFLGIFVTVVPCQLFLEANASSLGIRNAVQFYYATGMLSSVLDNAPTAMTFHALAIGLGQQAPDLVASVPAAVLKGIALGAVLFGSLTYIGNGPNFMIKALAEEAGIAMPHFFRYVAVFSLPVLVPVFVVTQWLFF